MKIFVKNNTMATHQMNKEVSQVSSREVLSQNIRSEKNILSSTLNGGGLFDKQEALKNLKKYQETYDRTCPETLSQEAKNQMWKRAKELKDKFVVGMLSKEEIHPVKSFKEGDSIQVVADYERMNSCNSVHRQFAWNKKNDANVREFKNIMRHLNPDDPMAADVEKFRPIQRGIR